MCSELLSMVYLLFSVIGLQRSASGSTALPRSFICNGCPVLGGHALRAMFHALNNINLESVVAPPQHGA
jgi:hypothetical protein